MRVLLLRHGETSWNAERRMQGQEDAPLSPLGQAQARAVAPLLQAWQPELVHCSDLRRARDTAALAGFADAFPFAHWREMHMGDWQGLLASEIDPAARQAWASGEGSAPNGETLTRFVARVSDGLAALPRHHQRVLVVCHGLVVKAAMVALLGSDYARLGPVRNCSITEIDWSSDNQPKLLRFNEVAWALPDAGSMGGAPPDRQPDPQHV